MIVDTFNGMEGFKCNVVQVSKLKCLGLRHNHYHLKLVFFSY